MIFYKDNPNLNRNVVVTITGEKEYRINCKYIKGNYYVINKDCFYVNNKWYRVDSGKIIFDYSEKKWVLVTELSIKFFYHGIVNFENGEPVLGYYSILNPYYTIPQKLVHYNNNNYSCIDYRLLINEGFVESLSTGKWFKYNTLSFHERIEVLKINNNENYNHLKQGYNIEDNVAEFQKRVLLYNDFKVDLNKDVLRYSKYLNNYSFGCEFESSQGYVPPHILNQLGIVPCRDGSVGGAEYVTIPLKGAKGLQTLKNVCLELTKRTNIDINCSYHVHIGNIPTTRIFLVTLWRLFYLIQDELYEMFPHYKVDPVGVKTKNYCQKLKRLSIYELKDFSKEGYKNYIDTVYQKIFTFLSEGHLPSSECNKKQKFHPIQHKWDRKKSRYLGLNLQNMLFSPRQTAEFRIHTPTTNPIKAINWLFICVAILQYAEKNTKKILTCSKVNNISIQEVLNVYKDSHPKDKYAEYLSDYLYAYFKHQKSIFDHDRHIGDKVSIHDVLSDKEFTFTYENTRHGLF